MDRMNDSNPGMVERQMDESPMEGRSSSDTELDRDHMQRSDRPVEREGMQGEGMEREGMQGEGKERDSMRGESVERESMQGESRERQGGYGDDRPADLGRDSTTARDW